MSHICLCDIAAEYFGESRHHFTAWKTLPSYLFLGKMCIVSLQGNSIYFPEITICSTLGFKAAI